MARDGSFLEGNGYDAAMVSIEDLALLYLRSLQWLLWCAQHGVASHRLGLTLDCPKRRALVHRSTACRAAGDPKGMAPALQQAAGQEFRDLKAWLTAE